LIVVRGGIGLCGKARHSIVESFVLQDSRHGIDAFEKMTQDVFGDVTASKGSSYGSDSLCDKQ
jgi:hypothetical protein